MSLLFLGKAKPVRSITQHERALLGLQDGAGFKVGKGEVLPAAYVGVPCSPQPTYQINAAFFWLQTQSQSHTVYVFGPKPMELHRKGLKGDYWGCPFAPSLVLLHCSLQGHHTFTVMAAECNQATRFSSSCQQGLAAAARGHLNTRTAPAHSTSGFG